MSWKPLVSIIIPVYCGSNYLREAIDCALSQTYPNLEILVINDGSDDDGATEKIALSYGDKIRYFAKENGGVSSALNRGIREMKGEYFSWLSHDDYYFPDKLEKQVKLLSTFPPEKRDTVLMCAFSLIDAEGKPIPRPVKFLRGEFDGLTMFSLCMKSATALLHGCGLLICKKLLDEVGFFDESLRYIQDCEYWYRMMIHGASFFCTEDKSVLYRVHDKQVTVRFPELHYTEKERVAKRLFERFFANPEERKFLPIYLCGCCRQLNPAAKPAIRRLKKEGDYPLSLRLKVWYYCVWGRITGLIKGIYHRIFH